MRVHNVIIICSGHVRPESGSELDSLLNVIHQAKKKPVLVLGPDGDDLLRSSHATEDCEIVFDPNFEGGFFSSLKAGLFAIHGPAFVVPLRAPAFAPNMWATLESALQASKGNEDILCPPFPQNTDGEPVFPLLVTTQGITKLKNLPAQSPWPLSRDVITFRDISIDDSLKTPLSLSH